MRTVGALTWAKLWREQDVAMPCKLEEDGTVRCVTWFAIKTPPLTVPACVPVFLCPSTCRCWWGWIRLWPCVIMNSPPTWTLTRAWAWKSRRWRRVPRKLMSELLR